MTRILFIALLVFVALSSSMASTHGRVGFVPVDGNATYEEVKAIKRAAEIANAVKNSDCFRDFMATRKLLETNGRTPDQVAVHIQGVSGKIPISFYFRCLTGSPDCHSATSAVAYRQPPDNAIYINRAYYDVERADFDIYELAGSLAHEAIGHSLGGYEHSFAWTSVRDFSVPYSISGASSENDDAFQHCREALGYRSIGMSPDVAPLA